jgi:hypothetical protein
MHIAHAQFARKACASALVAIIALSATIAHAAAPRISGSPATSVTVGQNYYFKPTASDSDGNRLTFSIVNKPAFASFSTSTGQLSGVPYAEHAKVWSSIVISVTDGSTKVSLPSFSLTVKPNANKSPTITGTPPTTARVGTAYTFTPTARDPEGRTLTFSVRNKPSWATFSTSTGRLSGTPSSTGTFSSILIVVTDGVTSASLPSFSIAVSSSGGSTGNSAPTISGTPATTARVGTAYSFQPTANDANGDPLTFSITNKPSWATFSTSTGRLSGTPSTTGTASNIQIRVSDGKTSTGLSAFSIAVSTSGGTTTGAATVRWTPPTRNTDGSTLTNLAGYRINYGKTSTSLTSTVTVASPGVSSYVIENLSSGTWYFAVKAYTSNGSESTLSTVASKSVP